MPDTKKPILPLILLTLMWGINWPMMKISLAQIPPLYFRSITMLLGSFWLLIFLKFTRVPVLPTKSEWSGIIWLGFFNIFGWHVLSILGVSELASGRAAIIGFTMPIFTVILGSIFFKQKIYPRTIFAVICVMTAIGLLLWHELAKISGRPYGVIWMILGALSWAWGTLQLKNHQSSSLSIFALTVWMLIVYSLLILVLAVSTETLPHPADFETKTWLSVLYGIFINYGYAQVIWFTMVKNLPPTTSAMSIMMVPVTGVLSATFLIHEIPHWQDWASILFVCLAIASSLLLPGNPKRT